MGGPAYDRAMTFLDAVDRSMWGYVRLGPDNFDENYPAVKLLMQCEICGVKHGWRLPVTANTPQGLGEQTLFAFAKGGGWTITPPQCPEHSTPPDPKYNHC